MRRFEFFGSYNSFRPFKIKVNSGANSQFTIPTFGGGYDYRLKVSGVVDVSGLTGNYKILFPLPNTDYIVEITGLFPRWYQNANPEYLKVKDVVQCGDIVWSSFAYAFYGCNISWSATDAPNLSMVTSLEGMFRQCYIANNIDFSTWDVSTIKNMSFMFWNLKYENILEIDFSNPTTGSLNLEDIRGFFSYTFGGSECRVPSVRMQAEKIQVLPQQWVTYFQPFYTSYTTEVLLIGLKVSWRITQSYGLMGVGVDSFFDALADITGSPTEQITITSAQNASGINTSKATDKGFTVVIV